jgi:hypothetical protein
MKSNLQVEGITIAHELLPEVNTAEVQNRCSHWTPKTLIFKRENKKINNNNKAKSHLTSANGHDQGSAAIASLLMLLSAHS